MTPRTASAPPTRRVGRHRPAGVPGNGTPHLTLDQGPGFTLAGMEIPPANTPVVCDLSSATDTTTERVAEYQRLFSSVFTGRKRDPDGVVRFRFRAEEGVEAWVRDLADREHACCAFMAFDVSTVGDEVHMAVGVIDNDDARAVLDEYYRLPETMTEDPAVLVDRYRAGGLRFVNGEPV